MGFELEDQPNPVLFGVEAAWNGGEKSRLQFYGGLESPWPSPFGQKWLVIK